MNCHNCSSESTRVHVRFQLNIDLRPGRCLIFNSESSFPIVLSDIYYQPTTETEKKKG